METPSLGVGNIVLAIFYKAKAMNIRLVKMNSHSSNGNVSPLKVIVMADGLFPLDAQINTFKRFVRQLSILLILEN